MYCSSSVQVALAVDNPAYQPWKPNCQMTPNQEDIIGGRLVKGMVNQSAKSGRPGRTVFGIFLVNMSSSSI